MNEAIQKLQDEIRSNSNNPYVKVIGDFLIQHIQANPDTADKFSAADKTILKSLNAMKEAARKKQHNGMAMLTDEEGFGIVLKYFGIDGKPAAYASVASDTPKRTETAGFDVKLDDLLGGL